ncbi:hypothetical protein BGZ65_006301, partial [Modicella reniformis]
MNSKEASIPMDLMLAQQKWNEEHQDELDEEFTMRLPIKRRRKTESSNADLNDDIFKAHESSKVKDSETTVDKKDKSGKLPSNDHDSAATSPGSSPSTSPKSHTSHNGRMGSKKSSTIRSASKPRSRSNSPGSNGADSHAHQHDQEPTNEDEIKQTPVANDMSPSTKRRKANMLSGVADSAEERSDVYPSSTKNRSTSRQSSKKNTSNEEHYDSSYDPISPSNSNNFHSNMPSVPSPSLSFKRSFSKRGGDRCQRNGNGSQHSTPTPNSEGTPQPTLPAPATVRYPSSKMTIQEMTKRAKQLLEYISRVQIDLADRKNKSGSASPTEESHTAIRHDCVPSSAIHHHRRDSDVKEFHRRDSDVKEFHLPPASASHATIHDDSQVCPDLSRSSMDSTASSVEGLHEPTSPQDVKMPINELGMTAK